MMSNCPKCSRPAGPADAACARCGLLRSRWDGYDAQVEPHPLLDPLWQQALSDWDEPKRHAALSAVAGQDIAALSALTRRYSTVLRERPDDPVARGAVDRLLQLAISLPVPTRGAAEAAFIRRLVQGTLGLLMMGLAGYLLYYLAHRGIF
jgi:hypothetical protein